MLQDHRELVTTQPRQRVAGPHQLAQQPRHLLQELVPDRVPTGIVDQLELIDVDVHQRMLAPIFVRLVQGSAQAGLELRAVHEACQRIVRGAVGHLAAQASLLGYIVEDQHDAEDLARFAADR